MALAVLSQDLVDLRHGMGDFSRNFVVDICAVMPIDKSVAANVYSLLALTETLEDLRQVVFPVLITEV